MLRRRWAALALLALPLLLLAGAEGVVLAPWAAAAVGGVVGCLAAWAARRGVRRDPALVALAALLGWAAGLAAVRRVDVAPAAWTLAGGVVAWVVAAAQRPRMQWAARWGVVLAGGAAAVHLAVERLVAGVRPGGPLQQPVLSATLAVLALALLPTLRRRRATAAVAGGVLLAGIVASGSRAALLAATVVALVWGVRRSGLAVRRLAGVVALVALVGLALRLVGDADPLRWERVRIWRVALRTVLAQAPWGAGPGGFADAALPHNFPRDGELARWYREPSLAESDVLQLAATLGVPGLLLGAAVAVALRRRMTQASRAVLVALAVGSAVNTQLPVPTVAIAAALAVVGSVRRAPAVQLWRLTAPQALAGGVLLAVAVGVALSWPRPGLVADAEGLAAEARRLAAIDVRTATLSAAEAVRRRPRWGEGRRLLASLCLAWGLERREAALIERAAAEFATARAVNPNDALAAYGEAEAAFLLGERRRATVLAREAVRLEPNFARAWLLLSTLAVAEGDLAAACPALAAAKAARRAAEGVAMISGWERELVRWDGARAALAGSACGGGL